MRTFFAALAKISAPFCSLESPTRTLMLPDCALTELSVTTFTDPTEPAEPVFKLKDPGVSESENPVLISIEPEVDACPPPVLPLDKKIRPPVIPSLEPAEIITVPVDFFEAAVTT